MPDNAPAESANGNDVFTIMQTTRSMRRLKPDPVPDELIAKILQAGACAANGGNTQRWRFLVIKDQKIKQAVAEYYKRAFNEVVGPRYRNSPPPPGVTKERYARQQAAMSVRAAITELPAKFRMAILLRYFDDLSYEEMAKALRCSMGTVASRLSRGHRMLAERLKGIVEGQR